MARYMNDLRPNTGRPFIFGRSVHNQRIEAMWGHINRGCLWYFADLFQQMEAHHGLDRNNEYHLLCLHLVFLRLIQQKLDIWRSAWNTHKIRTANNRSPTQMMGDNGNTAPQVVGIDYGIDWGTVSPSYVSHVDVPGMVQIPSQTMALLQRELHLFNLSQDDALGIGTWLHVVNVLSAELNVNGGN